jgi:hypothetical protein
MRILVLSKTRCSQYQTYLFVPTLYHTSIHCITQVRNDSVQAFVMWGWIIHARPYYYARRVPMLLVPDCFAMFDVDVAIVHWPRTIFYSVCITTRVACTDAIGLRRTTCLCCISIVRAHAGRTPAHSRTNTRPPFVYRHTLHARPPVRQAVRPRTRARTARLPCGCVRSRHSVEPIGSRQT